MNFPAIDPVALQIGPVAIKWYGLAYVAALSFAWWYARKLAGTARLWKTRALHPGQVDDLRRDPVPEIAEAIDDDFLLAEVLAGHRQDGNGRDHRCCNGNREREC